MNNDLRKKALEIANRRYAAKKFDKNRKLDPKDLETILEAGRLSPSSTGLETWKFLVIQNEEIRNEIKEFAPGALNALNGNAELVVYLYKKNVTFDSEHVKYIVEEVLETEYSIDSVRTQSIKNFHENMLKLEDEKDVNNWARRQTYIALGNMLTTAAMLDIDSVPIEGFFYSEIEDILVKHDLLDTKEYGVSVMAGFGYRDEDIKPKKRRTFDDVVKFVK